MGIMYKLSLPLYWSMTPNFKEAMLCDWFYLILKFICFNNNQDPTYHVNDEDGDRLQNLCSSTDIYHHCNPFNILVKIYLSAYFLFCSNDVYSFR